MMEEEIKKELVDDNTQTKSLLWMIFCTGPIVKQHYTDEVTNSPVLGVVLKKGGWPSISITSQLYQSFLKKIKMIQVQSEGEE